MKSLTIKPGFPALQLTTTVWDLGEDLSNSGRKNNNEAEALW
jgi:hypothetical protein